MPGETQQDNSEPICPDSDADQFISESLYRTVFETTGAATIIIEEDTKISRVNKKFEKLSGYSKDEVEGKKSWTDVIEKNCLEKMIMYHRARRVDADGAPGSYECQFIDRNGDARDVFINVAMIPGTKKSVASILDITDLKLAEAALKKRERELEIKTVNLEETNTALKVLLRHMEEDKKVLKDTIFTNIKELVLPYIEKLKSGHLSDNQIAYLSILETNLTDIALQFSQKMTLCYSLFTPTEIQVANLIKSGKTSKEIAELMNVSTGTINTHRNSIRFKLDLNNKKINLRTYLLSL